MPFYNLDNRLGGVRLTTAKRIVESGAKKNSSATSIISDLKGKGISYRRQEMLADIRHAKVLAPAKNPVAERNADTWYESVLEPFRAETGMSLDSALALLERDRSLTELTLEEAVTMSQYWEYYDSVFMST